MNNNNILEKIISPLSINDFLENYYYANKVLYLKNRDFSSIFSWNDFNDLIYTSNLFLAVSASSQEGNQKLNNSHSIDVIMEQVNLSKSTFKSDYVDKLSLKLENLVYRLSLELMKEIKINIYSSYPGVSAFGWHFDNYNIIILQIEGKKKWLISDRNYNIPKKNNSIKNFSEYKNINFHKWIENYPPYSGDHYFEDKEYLYKEYILEKGDLLFLPKAFWHKVECIEKPCLHLTIGLREHKFLDFFIWFCDYFIKKRLESYKFSLEIFKNKYLFENLKKEIINEINILFSKHNLLNYYFSEAFESKHYPNIINLPYNYYVEENINLIINNIQQNKKFISKCNLFFILEKNNEIIDIILNSQHLSIRINDLELIQYILSGNELCYIDIIDKFKDINKDYLINLLSKLVIISVLYFVE